MKVLVVNCGSSSLKYQLIDSKSESVLATGLCERIGIDGVLNHTPSGHDKIVMTDPLPDHQAAISKVLAALTDKDYGVISSLDQIEAVGHRLVHGGEKFASSVIITEEVIAEVEKCSDLAPLHNPATLIGVRACQAIMPGVPMVGVFDTAFHQTMPPKAYLYGVPHEYYEKYKVRRYGFHGTSHKFVSQRLHELAGLDRNDSRVIVCHLGNGASITAVRNGQSIDTSMGLTPLEGLMMGTRSGSLDPGIIEYIAHKENLSLEEVMRVLNKESGVLGLSGVSSDFRDLIEASKNGNKHATEAVEAFCYRVAKKIGSYVAALNGVDAIAFTAGIGENSAPVRKMVCEYLGYLGIQLQEENNQLRGKEVRISTATSKVAVYVIPTNEELAIARETAALVKK